MITIKPPYNIRNYISNLNNTMNEWNAPTRNKDFEYLKDKNIKTIIDIGANFGVFTDKCLQEFPDLVRIDVIEPDEINYEILIFNLEDNSKVHFHNCGIFYGEDEVNVVGTGDNSPGGYVVKNVSNDHCGEYIGRMIEYQGKIFKMKTLESLFDKSPDLIKIDVEGSEYNIIENTKILKECPYLIIEFHGHLKDHIMKYIQVWLPEFKIVEITSEAYGASHYWYTFLEKI
jgi:FkbM family methyltransferase